MVGLGLEHADSRLFFEYIDTGDNKACCPKAHSQCDEDTPGDIRPAADPRSEFSPSHRRQHECLIIHPTSGRVHAGNLSKRSGHTKYNYGDGEPSSDYGGRATIDQGVI